MAKILKAKKVKAKKVKARLALVREEGKGARK